MDPNNSSIQNIFEQNTTNMIFYEDSFAKTSFFTKEIPNWKTLIFYIVNQNQNKIWEFSSLVFPS